MLQVIKEQPEERLMAALLAAAPDFRPVWQAFLASWDGQPPGYYNAMAELAHYLVDRYAAGQTEDFGVIFQEVERFLPQLENLLGVGLLEDIQNIASHRSFGAAVFVPWLGPASLQLWQAVDEDMQAVAIWVAENPAPSTFNVEEALTKVENPELRKMLESMSRR